MKIFHIRKLMFLFALTVTLGLTVASPSTAKVDGPPSPNANELWNLANSAGDGEGTYGSGRWQWRQSPPTLILTDFHFEVDHHFTE